MDGNFLLAVDSNKTLRQMIVAGEYDWVNYHINQTRFPIKGAGLTYFEARLFNFGDTPDSREVVRRIKLYDTSHPWKVASLEHLLSLGALLPHEQQKYRIVAIRSVVLVRLRICVPTLGWGHPLAKRHLDLSLWEYPWSDTHQFLAVRPLPPPTK